MMVFVFEEDSSLLSLLTLYLEGKGHQVRGFSCEYSCPLYQLEKCTCPVEKPCADAVIVNTRYNDQEEVQILIDQDEKGCKLPKLNKAVMIASITKEREKEIRNLGFTVITKPFRLAAINEWLRDCKTRLKAI